MFDYWLMAICMNLLLFSLCPNHCHLIKASITGSWTPRLEKLENPQSSAFSRLQSREISQVFCFFFFHLNIQISPILSTGRPSVSWRASRSWLDECFFHKIHTTNCCLGVFGGHSWLMDYSGFIKGLGLGSFQINGPLLSSLWIQNRSCS